MIFADGHTTLTLTHSIFFLYYNQLSFRAFWSVAFLCATHLITFIFCHNCMGKISPLIPSACQITIRERVSKSAMCAVCRERKKRVHTPVEDKQAFQRYDISIIPVQDMNCSVILMVHRGTLGADRHVLHMVNCLAAGIPRSPPLTSTVLSPPRPSCLISWP